MWNKFLFSLFIVIISFFQGFCNQKLSAADSLFTEKKYTEAFEIYEELYKNEQASASMLMKMAFIKEGLDDYTQSIIYLMKYVELTGSQKGMDKIRDLADSHDLEGYSYTDVQYFTRQVQKYREEITALSLGISTLLLAFAFMSKKKEKSFLAPLIIAMLFSVAAFFVANNIFDRKSVIVISGKSLLMNGPSAGAELVDIIDKGHKIELLEKNSAWAKVLWMNEPVYIRSTNVRAI